MKKLLQQFLFIGLSAILSVKLAYASSLALMPGVTIDFTLNPNSRQEFTNFAFQTVTANCTITTDSLAGNDIFVEVLRKKGQVNDVPLSAGDTTIIHVNTGDNLRITAESGGKVALTNMGDTVVKARCVSQ